MVGELNKIRESRCDGGTAELKEYIEHVYGWEVGERGNKIHNQSGHGGKRSCKKTTQARDLWAGEFKNTLVRAIIVGSCGDRE